MRVILVRHGQTEWNRVERFRGRRDVPLNQTGLSQADLTGRRIAAEWRISAVYSSPLSRAIKTAEAIAMHFELRVQIRPALTDIDCGAWEGLTPKEVKRRWPNALDAWYNAPGSAHIPRGETVGQLRRRTWRAVSRLANLQRQKTIAIVGHAAVNRAVLLEVLGLGNNRFRHLGQDNCCINVLEEHRGDFTLVTMNDTCHLHDVRWSDRF